MIPYSISEGFPAFFQTEPVEKFPPFISPFSPPFPTDFPPFSLLFPPFPLFFPSFFSRTEPVEKEMGTPRVGYHDQNE